MRSIKVFEVRTSVDELFLKRYAEEVRAAERKRAAWILAGKMLEHAAFHARECSSAEIAGTREFTHRVAVVMPKRAAHYSRQLDDAYRRGLRDASALVKVSSADSGKSLMAVAKELDALAAAEANPFGIRLRDTRSGE